MLVRIAHFLKYHNAIPLTVAVVLVGASGAYAVNNPQVLFESHTEVVAVDNTYIADVDLEIFDPYVEIIAVTEDEEFYYVTYILATIDIVDAVWQDVEREYTLRVRESRLGSTIDLGLFVTEQLRQVVKMERERLIATQKHERRQVTNKQVATIFSGLIGARLDPTIETIPGYVPRIRSERPPSASDRLVLAKPDMNVAPPRSEIPAPPSITVDTPTDATYSDEVTSGGEIATNTPEIASVSSGAGTYPIAPAQQDSAATTSPVVATGTSPYLQLIGEQKVRLEIGASYTDFGVVIHGPEVANLTVVRYVNGQRVDSIAIETNVSATYEIDYVLLDPNVEYYRVRRLIEVITPEPEVEQSVGVGTTSTTSPVKDPPTAPENSAAQPDVATTSYPDTTSTSTPSPSVATQEVTTTSEESVQSTTTTTQSTTSTTNSTE